MSVSFDTLIFTLDNMKMGHPSGCPLFMQVNDIFMGGLP